MSTDTQPKIVKAGHIGNGDEFDVLGGAAETMSVADYHVCMDERMPAMEWSAFDSNGTSYAGPVFSLS